MNISPTQAQTALALAEADAHCELCGEPIPQSEVSVEAFEVTGMLVCTACIEDMLS